MPVTGAIPMDPNGIYIIFGAIILSLLVGLGVTAYLMNRRKMLSPRVEKSPGRKIIAKEDVMQRYYGTLEGALYGAELLCDEGGNDCRVCPFRPSVEDGNCKTVLVRSIIGEHELFPPVNDAPPRRVRR